MALRIAIALLLFTLLKTLSLSAQKESGHLIRLKLENYEANEVVLGFYFGDKPYVKDTADIDADGYFTFQADTLLPCGVYLFVLKPDNTFIQFLLPEKGQRFTMKTDVKDPVNKMEVKGSDDNRLFYKYLAYLNRQRQAVDSLKTRLDAAKENPADSARLAQQIADIDQQVRQYQRKLISDYPNTLSAKIVKSSLEPDIPEFEGADAKGIQMKKYYWYRAHYFDNIDLADPCLLRSPVLHPKVDNFVSKVVPQHPDSINVAIDTIIQRVKDNPETYKYFLIHFLNTYAKSNIVGMDACYVHVAQQYYCNGGAPWVKPEDLEKICDNARRLEPILIGKIAPNIFVRDSSNRLVSLWDVDADYTVLFFWAPDCGHCKKAAPFMVDFAQKFKDRNVKIFAVCTAVVTGKDDADTMEKVHKTCWEGAREKGFDEALFINTYDPYLQSRYKQLYDIQSTPQIFILDRKHEILMKRIGAEKLAEVMEDVIRFQEERKKGGERK